MNPKYLLDTNICIYLMKRQPPEVEARFAQCYVGEVVMSTVTLAELHYGVVCSGQQAAQNRAALADLLEVMPAAPFDTLAAAAYAAVRLATRDSKRDTLDKLIAAQAIALDAVLVTNNVADFQRYPGVRIENWLTASS